MISEIANKDRHKSQSTFWICVFPLAMTKIFLGQVLAELVVNSVYKGCCKSKAPLEFIFNISDQTIYSWLYINEGLPCSEPLAGIFGSQHDQDPVILKA